MNLRSAFGKNVTFDSFLIAISTITDRFGRLKKGARQGKYSIDPTGCASKFRNFLHRMQFEQE